MFLSWFLSVLQDVVDSGDAEIEIKPFLLQCAAPMNELSPKAFRHDRFIRLVVQLIVDHAALFLPIKKHCFMPEVFRFAKDADV